MKPREIRDAIKVFANGGNCLELFAREKVDGWDSWGNEVECDIELKEDNNE